MAKKILMTGNDVIAEAAIRAGCRFYAGYPITPQNELTAYMARRMSEVGGTFIQSESELAAVSMVFGASLAGVRAMTSSSSPGISLKQEGISYLAGCQLPAVIVNIMRGGPGLGNISPSQADYFQATRGGGHGDYRTIVLAPASLDEAARLTMDAFDLADKYRTPVMVLGDGLLGQMMEPVTLPPPQKKIPKRNWILDGCQGRRPRVIRSLLLKEGELERWNEELQRRYKKIEKDEVRCELVKTKDAEIIIVAFGTSGRIAKSALLAARRAGMKVGLIRPITLWPYPYEEVRALASKAKAILTVEMNCGQMVEDVKIAATDRCPVKFLGRSGGGVPTEDEILRELRKI